MTIAGTTVPTPTSLTVDIEPIDKAQRSESGLMNIKFVANKRKLSCTWEYLTNAQVTALFAIVSSSTRILSIVYPDPVTGADRTGNFYTGAKGCGLQKIAGGAAVGWTSVSFNCIEQ